MMKVTPELLRVFWAALPEVNGRPDFSEVDTALQAVLDHLAPEPETEQVIKDDDLGGHAIWPPAPERVSEELTEVRTVLSRADSALLRLRNMRQYDAQANPEQFRMRTALESVVAMLEPWARKGWRRRTAGRTRGPRR